MVQCFDWLQDTPSMKANQHLANNRNATTTTTNNKCIVQSKSKEIDLTIAAQRGASTVARSIATDSNRVTTHFYYQRFLVPQDNGDSNVLLSPMPWLLLESLVGVLAI